MSDKSEGFSIQTLTMELYHCPNVERADCSLALSCLSEKRFPERQYMLLHNLFISLTDVLITHSVH